MSGRLGIELQPKHMTDEERQQCTTCFADYKELRQTVQTGELYRLVNPYNRKGVASLMYVNEDQSQAVVFAYKVDNYYSMPIPRIRLKGLDANATYTVKERDVKAWQKPCELDGRTFTGRFLMEVGLEIPLNWDYASRVLEIRK
jgi:alpha-galactosidase